MRFQKNGGWGPLPPFDKVSSLQLWYVERHTPIANPTGVFFTLPGPCVHMSLSRTCIGAVSPETRDAVAEYRDENDLPNYDAALQNLLADAGVTDTLSANP